MKKKVVSTFLLFNLFMTSSTLFMIPIISKEQLLPFSNQETNDLKSNIKKINLVGKNLNSIINLKKFNKPQNFPTSNNDEFNKDGQIQIKSWSDHKNGHHKTNGDRKYSLEFDIDLSNQINSHYLGDWKNGEYLKDSSILITNGGDFLEYNIEFDDYGTHNDGYSMGLFYKANDFANEEHRTSKVKPTNSYQIIELDNKDTNVTTTNIVGNRSIHWNVNDGYYERDYALSEFDYKFNFNATNGILNVVFNDTLKSKDRSGGGWGWGNIKVNFNLNSTKNIYYDFHLPYTQYDLTLFEETFKEIVCQQIIIKNATNSIIFDYDKNSKNEQVFNEIVNNRINEFFNNTNIINSPLGPISIWSNEKGKYVGNDEAGQIIANIPDSIRGLKGTKEIEIRYQLPKGRIFKFFNNESYLSFKVKVSTQLSSEADYSIDDLITITPYKGSSDGYHDNFLIKEYQNCRLGQNSPLPNEISSFNVNINEAKYIQNNNNQNLIIQEKFPVIAKAGTIIKPTLKIKLGEYTLEKVVEFNRIFNNGKIYSSIVLDKNDYNGSNISIVGNKINLGLEIVNGKINIFNTSKIMFSSNDEININSCSIEIKQVEVSIPSEQVESSSKWIQTEAAKFINDKNKNIRYVGAFKIYDPFHLEMENKMIDVRDPITNLPLGTFSQYKPYIVTGKFDTEKGTSNGTESPIYPSAANDDGSSFKANLGPYIMANRKIGGNFEFHIIVKEFDINSKAENIEDRYTNIKWAMNINMELLDSKTNLKMLGYSDNQNINDINDQKYFNEEDVENYRGDFANRETGMYIPKIVWVNAYPPESFLYDPRNKNGELIKDNKFDIGYIAELNGTAFASGDYASNITFGGFEILFDENKFTPTGLIPYIQKYTFNKNSIEPRIEQIALSASGYQTADANYDFGQIVLKRPNSNTFLYQFFRINTQKEILKYRQDLISIYGNRIGLKNQPLFVDFWDTYHGNNLMNYLLNRKLIEDEEKIRVLEYNDVIQYWNIYVNDPDNYNNSDSIEGNNIAKFSPNLGYSIHSTKSLDQLKQELIDQITKILNELLIKEGWVNSDKPLTFNEQFRIEENDNIFNQKLNQLILEYDKSLLESQIIDFNVVMIDEGFNDRPIKITGKNTISVLNNKDANKIIDLSKYKGSTLLINTTDSYYEQSNQYQLVKQVEEEIYRSLNNDLKRIMNDNSQLGLGDYLPQESIDYRLRFHNRNGQYFENIEEAIRNCLLIGTSGEEFNNDLVIEVEAIFNNESHFMKNSFQKIINNNPNNPATMEMENFDLSQVIANDLKINTTKDGILNEIIYWNSNDDIDTKANGLFRLILNRVQNDINLYARRWMNAYDKTLSYGIDYEIKLIKSIEGNNVIYYETSTEQDLVNVIKEILLNGIENEIDTFNRTLMIDVVSVNYSNNPSYAIGSFRKTINNSYMNEGIEDDDNSSTDIVVDNDSMEDIRNNKGSQNNINLWWIITPITIFGILAIVVFSIIKVRKNRRIR